MPSCGNATTWMSQYLLHLLAGEQQAARRPQPADGADVGEQPEERRAVHDADFDAPEPHARATSAGS